jgi:hypothetical protein
MHTARYTVTSRVLYSSGTHGYARTLTPRTRAALFAYWRPAFDEASTKPMCLTRVRPYCPCSLQDSQAVRHAVRWLLTGVLLLGMWVACPLAPVPTLRVPILSMVAVAAAA